MRGRNKNRGEKRIPTVSSSRKTKTRIMKSKDELDRIVYRVKMIGSSELAVDRISNSHYGKSIIATNITKCIREFELDSWRRIPAHRLNALSWVVKESIRLIKIEKDPTVMFWLWRLLRECRGCRTGDFQEFEGGAIVPRLVSFVLEQKPDVLVRSAVLYLVYQWGCYGPPEELEKLARICQGILVDFHARKGKLPDKELKLPFCFVSDNEYVEVPAAIAIIGQILRWSGEEGRLRDFIHELDYGLLQMMSGRITHELPNHRDTQFLAVRLLKCGLQMGDEMLQRMLGLGFLYSAEYMAWLHTDGDDEEADTFRAVLAAHPEWKQKFRELTAVEDPISHTAQLGETIPARVAKPAEYTLE